MIIEKQYFIASEHIAAGRWSASADPAIADEILLSYHNPETVANFDGSFKYYGNIKTVPCPELHVFEDSWIALAELGQPFLDMLAALDERKLGHVASLAELAAGLESVGFVKRAP